MTATRRDARECGAQHALNFWKAFEEVQSPSAMRRPHPRDYSERNACIGSTFVALRAGTYDARSATTASTAPTAA